jgi:glycosyltransferase involved in cell wall biosynthesis
MSQTKILNLIEPTLYDQTGHGYSYTQCLIKANSEFNFDLHVWLDRKGKGLLDAMACKAHTYFFRPFRQIQKIFLYRRLVKQPGIIFVGTSELWDLKLLAYFTQKYNVNAKIFLHFHQFRQTDKKLASLRRLAKFAENFIILTPTKKLSGTFIKNGFTNCTVIPCPTYTPVPSPTATSAKFTRVLYAGAARNDKGFPEVIKTLEYNRAQGKDTKFEIQISAPSSQRYDNFTQMALSKLQSMPKKNLVLHRKTLNQTQYLDLFNNSVCLLLYNQKEYQDKFSGIALDAFYAGCPIITAKNTWMGDTAEQYGAGVTLDRYTPAAIQNAIDHIIENYEVFHVNAKSAAQELTKLHDPKHTLAFINSMTQQSS